MIIFAAGGYLTFWDYLTHMIKNHRSARSHRPFVFWKPLNGYFDNEDPDEMQHLAALFCLFDLFLYVHSTIFQLCGTVLPGLNQY